MKSENKSGNRIMNVVNKMAKALVVQTANSACIWVTYQPEFPEEANRFKKKGGSPSHRNR